MKSLQKNQVLAVCLCICTTLGIGYIYCFGIIEKFFINHYSWSNESLSAAFSLALMNFSLSSLACSYLLKKMGYFQTLLLASMLFLLAFTVLSLAVTESLVFIGFGFLCGSGTGFAYQSIISFLHSLTLKNHGFIESFALCGFALSGTICGGIIQLFARYIAWRYILFSSGIISFLLLLFTAVFIKSCGQYPPAERKNNTGWGGDMLRSRSFLYFFFWIFMISMLAMGHLSNASIIIGNLDNLSDNTVFILMLPFANALGRFIYTIVNPFFRLKKLEKLINNLMLVSFIMLFSFSATTTVYWYIGSAFLCLTIFGFVTAMLPAYVDLLYGSLYFSIHYAICNLQAVITSFGGPFLVSNLIHHSSLFFIACIALLHYYAGIKLYQYLK